MTASVKDEEKAAATVAAAVALGVRCRAYRGSVAEPEMGARLVRAATGLDDIRAMDAASPFGHVCSPGEVAEAVLFLVTSGYVNDQRITVDGGTF